MITFKIKEMITQEIKTKIMYLYYGQNVYLYDREKPHVFDSWPVDETNVNTGVDETLVLKSLSNIPDEDAIELAKIKFPIFENSECKVVRSLRGKEGLRILFMKSNGDVQHSDNLTEWNMDISQIDAARAKGIALPAFGFTVDQLIEAGVFTLIKQ